MPYKVYLTLGFHINCYHSWRGDSPDEAGFGTDIRVMRRALQILDQANAAGLKARAYWDSEVYWTWQEILPRHAPDLLPAIRRRVQAGLDEIVVGPFNNGANHAATADEFRASLAWALENPWGTGLRQLFGATAPFYRSQETMFTTGQEAILREYGLEGTLLYYAGVPFNTLSCFTPALPLEQRYNPLWFRSREDQPRLIVLPCIAAADLIEQVSLENLMLDLHRRQESGEIRSDVLIHLNEDADLETWLPARLPRALSWFPNLGGLEEFIRLVNRYAWADFTLPSEYVAAHPPRGEILVRQDLADGGFDGNYSWAEKCASLRLWTVLEQSRLASYRAQALANRSGLDLSQALWEGMESAFFQRLIGLSTTHFGMSTPIINEERQERAFAILDGARRLAEDAERAAAVACKHSQPETGEGDLWLYEIELYPTPPDRGIPAAGGRIPVSLPIILPEGVMDVRVEATDGAPVHASLTDLAPLPGGKHSARLRFVADFSAAVGVSRKDAKAQRNAFKNLSGLSVFARENENPADPGNGGREPATFTIRVYRRAGTTKPPAERSELRNRWLALSFSERHGLEHFAYEGQLVGGQGMLDPFVTYRGATIRPQGYTFVPLDGERWDGVQRLRLQAELHMRPPLGRYVTRFTYTFTLFDELPYVLVEVEADYAYTPPRQVIHNLTQKLRRRMDLHWVETAPFQLTPALEPAAGQPLRVWKHNYLGITSHYDLDYARINPRNRQLDAFNHQVTAGWVAVTDGRHGLLLGESADALASMAFCPMRLRERGGVQRLSLNPFGSYYGRQFDYAHLGGNGNGAVIMQAFSGALQPNGPSYNGQRLCFALLLAPYAGNEPPLELQRAAVAHFYPPGAMLHSTPDEIEALTLPDLEALIDEKQRHGRLLAGLPLDPPTALLVNPSQNALDLVWDAPRAGPVTGYEVEWRLKGETAWRSLELGDVTRWHVEGLDDGQPVRLRLRSRRGPAASAWTPVQTGVPGAVTDSSVAAMLPRVPLWTLLKVMVASLESVLKSALRSSST